MPTNRPEPMPEKLWLTATMQFAADDAVKAGEGTPPLPRFNMVAYTGGSMRLAEWKYPVVVDLAGLAIPSQNRPIRVGHNTDRLVGHTNAIAQESGRLVASGVLSIPGPDADRVVAGSRNGFPWQASIGARVDQFEFVKEGQVATANGREFAGPVVIVRKSTLGEISFVDLGADGNTSASVAASAQETSTMTTATNSTDNLAATAAADAVTAVRTATANEAKRIAAIRKVFDGKHPDIEAQAIEEGWDATRAELEYLRVKRPAAPTVSGGHGGLPSADVIEAALCKTLRTPNREKLFSEQTLEAVDKRFNGLGLQELVVMAAQANGYTGRLAIHRETLPAIFRAAFGPVQAAFSTLSLPGIFSNVANKELLAGFQEEDQTWREVSTVKTVSDFKQITSYRMLDDMEYEELPPGGEMKHGKFSEESYTRQVRTYAKMFSLNREDLINDDLSAFEDIRTRLGGGAARKFNNVFWTRFLDNATFFTAGRGNYITGATTALDINGTGLQAGILAFRKLKSPDGKRVGGAPVLLLVPPELQFIAQRLYQSTTVNTGGASANDSVPNDNIHAGKYRPVVCDWLSDAAFTGQSAKAWYLFRAAAILASVVVSFLDGVQTPTVDMAEADFNQLGVQFRGYHDFGVDFAEWLAGIKVKGEA
jgi:phage major head subunit gpT-like protein